MNWRSLWFRYKVKVKALLFGTKLKASVTALVVLSASVGGAFALGFVGVPSVVGVDNRFGETTDATTLIHSDLQVHNPNPIDIRLGDTKVAYTVNMNDVAIARGDKTGLDIESGNSTLNFTTRMQNTKIPDWWVTHIERGERTNVTVDAAVETNVLSNRTFDVNQQKTVETNIIGQFNSDETRPIRKENPPPAFSNPVLYVNRTRASWGPVSESATPIQMEFTVYNPDELKPYVVTKIGYEITMNGITVGEGATDESKVIPSQATSTLEPETVIETDTLDEWWVSHLRNDQRTELRIDFYAEVKPKTTSGTVPTIRVPLNELTYEKTIRTDIFGTKGRDGGTNNGTAATPTPTPTRGGSDATPTPGGPGLTPSPLPGDGTATPTDGGLVGSLAAPATTDSVLTPPPQLPVA